MKVCYIITQPLLCWRRCCWVLGGLVIRTLADTEPLASLLQGEQMVQKMVTRSRQCVKCYWKSQLGQNDILILSENDIPDNGVLIFKITNYKVGLVAFSILK